MKTNRPISKSRRSSAKKSRKKASVHPLTEFEGESYTGLQHKQTWALGKGSWEEQRTGAQSWDIAFETIAIKPLKAGTGLPVGSEHHSYILAHQKLVKTRNNTYQLRIEGVKFKLAHKEGAEGKWSANAGVRKRNMIRILQEALLNLEMGHGQAPSQTRKAPDGTEPGGPAPKTRKARKKRDNRI